jgi:hypothetical protein
MRRRSSRGRETDDGDEKEDDHTGMRVLNVLVMVLPLCGAAVVSAGTRVTPAPGLRGEGGRQGVPLPQGGDSDDDGITGRGQPREGLYKWFALFSYVYGAQLLGNRCEYFKGLLANGMSESQAGEVVLEDVDVGASVIIMIITYIIIIIIVHLLLLASSFMVAVLRIQHHSHHHIYHLSPVYQMPLTFSSCW